MKRFFATILLLSILLSFAACGEVIPDIFPTASGEEEGKHSELLMSVLNDSYYNSLIISANNNNIHHSDPRFDAHPFAFLENQGIDVDKIRDGTYPAYTMSYVLDEEPNNLYIHTRVLIDDNYYQSHLVTYKLTNQEMSDYKMMHGDSVPHSYKQHAFFLNEKISEMKEPTEIVEIKYTKSTYSRFENLLNASTVPYDFFITNIGKDKSFIYALLQKTNPKNTAVKTQNIILQFSNDPSIEIQNNIFNIPHANSSVSHFEEHASTIFDLTNVSICTGQDFELEN